MPNTALTSANPEVALSPAQLEQYAQGWLLDGEIRQHSRATHSLRRLILSKLVWFLRQQEYASCGILELRQFLAYVSRGHEQPGGRWDNPQQSRAVRPTTVRTSDRHLRTFFRWMIAEGVIARSPMEGIAAPVRLQMGDCFDLSLFDKG